MHVFSEIELREAARAIVSARMKSEKAVLKLKDGSAQQRLIARGIAAYSLALALIASELGGESVPDYEKEALEQAAATLTDLSARVEKALPKFAADTPQHTLAVRRLRAFEIACRLLNIELER
ncbi:MAG: hypothetical protein GX417_06755 [Clostridiales bacterium]|nr:hypothetical protein [Clostridiales bacterium]